MNATTSLAPDAAVALGIASTALPFAESAAAASESWLRILRLQGEAGVALQALGVGEGTIETEPEGQDDEPRAARDGDPHALSDVTDAAARIAGERGADWIATTDLLLAVMCVYGEDFDRTLRAHGTDRDELSARLGVTTA
ncbi:MAG: hypothetical protein ACYCU0_07035 [Solirubrobacteraceae bacterium]